MISILTDSGQHFYNKDTVEKREFRRCRTLIKTQAPAGVPSVDCLCSVGSVLKELRFTSRKTNVAYTFFTFMLTLGLLAGCASPEIGDSCETTYDCDIQQKRFCDTTQPEGYCTLGGCEKNTCPEDSFCILFRPEPDRLTSTWCMQSCDDNGDCRDGYACTKADQFAGGNKKEPLAQNLDKASGKFCVVSLEK